jgi:L-ascorbate metabolism protein UlaG (beta-lactamase superfamily)
MKVRGAIRKAGRLLFALIVIAMFAPYVVPPFLDRIYYRGPMSDHFDGEHFYNPDGMVGHQATGEAMRGPMMFRFLAGSDKQPWPVSVPVTSTKPPARVLGEAMRVTWIGHSTVLVQTQGLNILTDPVWSERASPVSFAGPKRVREPGVPFEDLPHIDLVLLSHNHYDHFDLPTIERLWARDKPRIVTSLGNDTILAGRGVPAVARDWGGQVAIRPGITVIVDRVHHWGSRWGKDRNRALWSGFTVTLPGGNLFFAGDTGPGDMTWPAEAAKHGPVRMALIPVGAFRPRQLMSGNHIGPQEAVQAFRLLGAAYALGVHWGTFQLTTEKIDEPRTFLAAALARAGIAPDRFRTTEAGVQWDVPAMPAVQPANKVTASASVSAMPSRSASAAR